MTDTGVLPADMAAGPFSEMLYESSTTRVWRIADAGVICKEPLGPAAAQRLGHEGAILAGLAAVDGVAKLASGPRADGLLVLRDCGGEPLARRLRGVALPPLEAIDLAAKIARTLTGIHRAAVVHRDINPSNILLAASQEPVLIDFDSAAWAHQPSAPGATSEVVGTLGYLAPEQTGRTGRGVDHRADLYALGVTIYEMATGRLPFDAQDALQLVHDHLVREPVPPSRLDERVPDGLSRIVLRLLAKVPEQRYQSAEGLLHDLERLRTVLAEGGDDAFALGERDFPARLAAPARLVGREAELALLRQSFADVLRESARIVLVAGAAGVGKTMLVNELRPVVAEAGGLFLQGKFDQYQREGATDGGVTQVLRGLGRVLLASDDIAGQKERLLAHLGRNAALITRWLPEFALLLGEQSDALEVDPQLAESQMREAIVALFTAVASPARPIAVVLDDLQWAGALSLRTIERLALEPRVAGLLLIGTYRTEPLHAADSLTPLLASLRDRELPAVRIELAGMPTAESTELIAGMLRLDRPWAERLARAIGEVAAGNPFDTVELINELRAADLLRIGRHGWEWDEDAIVGFAGRKSVADLLAARIARLPEASRLLLDSMSCLGNVVDAQLLHIACGLEADELDKGLHPAIEEGLALVSDGAPLRRVRFTHDRVQQAVLGSMGAGQRESRHLLMARRLAARPEFEAEAAQQYLACAGLLSDADEKLLACRLFHRLARRLADAASNLLAERYLAAASELLADRGQHESESLRAEVDAARHAALYSLGRLQEADLLFAQMQAARVEPLDIVEPACLQMRSLDMRARLRDSFRLGRQLLARLGQEMSEGCAADTQERLDTSAAWLAQESALDHRSRAQITDRRTRAVARLMSCMVRAAYFLGEEDAFAWLLMESRRMWDEHGPCPELVAGLGRLSVALIRGRHDYFTGCRIARHVVTVGETLGYEPQTSEARFIYCTFAGHWIEPLENVLEQLERAFAGVRESGDASYASYVHLAINLLVLETAPSLDEFEASVARGGALAESTGNAYSAGLHLSQQQLQRALRRQPRAPVPFGDAQGSEATLRAREASAFATIHTDYRTLHALVMGDFEFIARHADTLASVRPFLTAVHNHVALALARAWQLRGGAEAPHQQEQHLENPEHQAQERELEGCRAWLAARATDQPHNFLHLLRLVEAEQAWALARPWDAAKAFDAAVLESGIRSRPWHAALIKERAGRFYLQQGLTAAGRDLLARARDAYQAWGAAAKAESLRNEYDFLRATQPQEPQRGAPRLAQSSTKGGSNSVLSESLDLLGVLRASQALSSETSLDRLAARVTEVVAALSGATQVLVLSCVEGRWSLLAPGGAPIPVSRAAQQGLVPQSVFSYVERTREVLVIDDAVADDRFSRDPYFDRLASCSMMAAPIAIQGEAGAILLLENRQGRAAFNAQSLDAVMLIAGQLAVSLGNAQLYESLEERVQARTRELQEMQAELVATARRAGMAEIANNVLHNVGNVLNSINVSASVVRHLVEASRGAGLDRAVALLQEHQHDLPDFLGRDSRGAALFSYLKELAAALRAERQDMRANLDRLTRSVEHVSYIVSTQQSHAGPSSLLEATRPQELLEEALRLSAKTTGTCGIAVVRRYADLPPAALDRPRMLQILVNLIDNAAQAMANTAEGSRVLTLGTGIVDDRTGSRLRITVGDCGEGIAPENLRRLFAHGFTTRKNGHGFGLHSSALAAMEMGGRLLAHSEGAGRGSTFTLELPVAAATREG
ncbi:trifunctional serine/threonine-protein kinase/ATP-binding protein/sensor histidine kinase [Ramlibacter sp.]|uniref:trifunctional serine/threonine-protein kinase/ATP-binding protein/sensor histidine kinase n=1 Tax=Ramlibacter sp. TaxID=1917967 RepID=UPI002D8050AF|nr:AAA family ATPase [Ramlibacter sp.]